jgi:hypothetical protein
MAGKFDTPRDRAIKPYQRGLMRRSHEVLVIGPILLLQVFKFYCVCLCFRWEPPAALAPTMHRGHPAALHPSMAVVRKFVRPCRTGAMNV